MVTLYQEGFLPLIQVHDELDLSFESPKEANKIKEIMEHCIELKVPSVIDLEEGPSWGEAK